MNTLVILGNKDLTPHIDWKNYKLQSQSEYESWEDGNFVEHRIYIRERITGTFRVWLAGGENMGEDAMDTDAFIELFNSATNNHITTMTVYDQASNSMKAITAYCEITPVKHGEMINGNYFDILSIRVDER